MTNPETGVGNWKAVLIEDGLWTLLDKYGWQITKNSYHGLSAWTSDNTAYKTFFAPFYLMKAGGVSNGVIANSGWTGDTWSGASSGNSHPGGAFVYGIGSNTVTVVSTNISQHRAFPLRCLTP